VYLSVWGSVNFHDSMSPESGGGQLSKHDEILQRLLHVPVSHHCLIIYSDLKKIRSIYAAYIKRQIEEQPDSITLLFPYYDDTKTVREALNSEGLDATKLERTGALVTVDIAKVLETQYFDVPGIERLGAFVKQVEEKNKNKTLFVIADKSVFHHLRKSKELLEYEKNLHQDLKTENRKELCLYHERDLESMFSESEAAELESYHNGKVITI
jgi:hypothetical protein